MMAGKVFALAEILQIGPSVASWFAGTEKYYDLTGSMTYILLTLSGRSEEPYSVASLKPTELFASAKKIIAGVREGEVGSISAAMTLLWAFRLGSFLFLRVLRSGGDRRFSRAKSDPKQWALFWGLQGLWVFLTAMPTWLSRDSRVKLADSPKSAYAAVVLWTAAFLIESIADGQKAKFRRGNPDGFISHGLWAVSRHPNYAAEIVVWAAQALLVAPVDRMACISPVFVFLLLRFVSGVPILEKSSDKRYGHLAAYQSYKASTPLLFPLV